jgi:opacity protein-like surface antigen
LLALASALLVLPAAHAADNGPLAELQVYPTGQIAGIGWQSDLPSLGSHYQGAATLRFNKANRGSAGRHADESGEGWGVGFAVDRYFAPDKLGWSLGGRVDVFNLRIDYRDPGVVGGSQITVLQPALVAGFTYKLWPAARLKLSLGLGSEINTQTSGAPVGEGPIGLLGLSISWR